MFLIMLSPSITIFWLLFWSFLPLYSVSIVLAALSFFFFVSLLCISLLYSQTFLYNVDSSIMYIPLYSLYNVAKHSGEYRQTFRGMLPSIPRNMVKHSGNVVKHSSEYPIYLDGREMVEASSITFIFSGELLIVCSVVFCVENVAKFLAARFNSVEDLISMPWKSFENFLLVSGTQD